MTFIRSLVNGSVRTVCSFGALKVASYIKVSFIVGSSLAFFSGSSVAMPLIGALGGTLQAGLTLLLGVIIRSIVTGGLAFSYLIYHIPGLCAAAYWNINNRLVRITLPLICMVAFILHPIGGQAWAYSLYWLVPVAISLQQRSRHIFLQALATTFMAHAVGSVIWLYTVPMTAAQWLGLIPVVAFERLLFSTSIALGYALMVRIKNYQASISMQKIYSVMHPLLKQIQ